MARRKIRSKKHSRRRKEARRNQLVRWLIASLILVAGLVGLTHWSAVQIQEIKVSTDSQIDAESVGELTRSVLAEPWLGVVSHNNILLLPRRRIRERVAAVSPQIKAVNVDVTGLQSVAISLDNRQAVGEVCSSAPAGNCQLVDQTGFIFKSATGSSSSPIFTYQSEGEISIGERFLAEERFRSLNFFIDTLSAINMESWSVAIEPNGDLVIPVVRSGENTTASSSAAVDLKLNLYDDLAQIFSNLQTVVENDSFVTETPQGGEDPEVISPFSLEYIDLRFENKIFYK